MQFAVLQLTQVSLLVLCKSECKNQTFFHAAEDDKPVSRRSPSSRSRNTTLEDTATEIDKRFSALETMYHIGQVRIGDPVALRKFSEHPGFEHPHGVTEP